MQPPRIARADAAPAALVLFMGRVFRAHNADNVFPVAEGEWLGLVEHVLQDLGFVARMVSRPANDPVDTLYAIELDIAGKTLRVDVDCRRADTEENAHLGPWQQVEEGHHEETWMFQPLVNRLRRQILDAAECSEVIFAHE